MNKWKERADEYKKQLEEAQEWIDKIGFANLPDGVKSIICRGEIATEEKIDVFEKLAMEKAE